MFPQVAADASVVRLIRVDAFNVYRFPLRQRLDLGSQLPVKQGFRLILGI
jgi:hypothetical protein